MLARIMAVAAFTREPGNYLLKSIYKDGKDDQYYTSRPTANMHYLLSDYKKVFNKAYGLAATKVWWFAWKAGGEKYRINCALLQIDKAKEILTTQKWEG